MCGVSGTIVRVVLGLGALTLAVVLGWLLVVTRPARIRLMSRMPPALQADLASLSATAWLFPVMFACSAVQRLTWAAGTPVFALQVLSAVATALAAFHVTRSSLRLVKVLRAPLAG